MKTFIQNNQNTIQFIAVILIIAIVYAIFHFSLGAEQLEYMKNTNY